MTVYVYRPYQVVTSCMGQASLAVADLSLLC